MVLLLAGSLVEKTGTYPPESAHLLGTEAVVPLHWDLPGKDFYLTVTASGRTVFQGAVTGNRYDLPVRSGSLVRWNVVPVGQGGQEGVFHSFQYSNQSVFHFQGKTPVPRANPPQALDGMPGPHGVEGPSIVVQLQQTSDGVSLQVENQKYLLLPSTRPILIESVGSDGGSGNAGQQGMAGSGLNTGSTQSMMYLNGGPGGNGGDGGHGGRGGLITVYSNGLPVEPFVQFDVRGGGPGLPGPGGPGGAAGFAQTRGNSYGTLVGQVGPPGQAGRPGQPGPPGQVIIRP